jgi:hypothetical protein
MSGDQQGASKITLPVHRNVHQCPALFLERSDCDCDCHRRRNARTCRSIFSREGPVYLTRAWPVGRAGEGRCCPPMWILSCRLFRGHAGDHTDSRHLYWGEEDCIDRNHASALLATGAVGYQDGFEDLWPQLVGTDASAAAADLVSRSQR